MALKKNVPVRSRARFLHRGIFALSLACASLAAGHDLTTSYATVRFKADALELQVKIAADSAWSAVQATVAPGAVFVLEEFETVGKSQLIAFGRQMEELTIDGKVVPPRAIAVAVVEDNFVFTFLYPRPSRGPVQMTEKYLKLMAPDYASRVAVVDQNDKPIASKTLHIPDVTFSLPLPASPAKSPSGSPARP